MFLKRKVLLIIALGAILIFLIYRSAIDGYFLSEDYEWWPYVKGESLFKVLGYFISPPVDSADASQSLIWSEYRPLTGLAFWLNVNLSWMNPIAFHLTNLIIHLGNFLLVVILAYGFLKKIWPAALAGFIFIIFPFHSEVVVWLDARSSSLAAFFYLGSFYLFSKWIKSLPQRPLYLCLSLLSFLVALTAKETAASLPLALMSYTVFNQRGNFLQRLKRATVKTAVFWVALISYFIFRGFYVGELNVFAEASDFNPLFTRVATLYLIFLVTSLVLFITMQKSKNFHTDKVKLMLFLATLIGIFFLPTIWIPTQERYLYLPSSAASMFIANLFFIFWDNEAFAKMKFSRLFLALILFFTSVFSVSYLSKRVDNWRKASLTAQKILSDFRVYAKDISEDSSLYFFNVPDSYHGSYIFRAYLSDAIYYDSGKSFKRVLIPSTVRGLGNSAVIIEGKNKLILESNDHYVVSMPNFSQSLPFGGHVIETEDYQILWENDQKLNLTLKKDFLGKENVYFFYYDPNLNRLLIL